MTGGNTRPTTQYGKWFVVVQAVIAVPWLTGDYHRGDFAATRFGGAMLLLILLSVGFCVSFSRTPRELDSLQTIRNAP